MSHSPRLDPESGYIDFLANNFTYGGPNDKRENLFWIPANFESLIIHNKNLKLSVQCTGAMAIARLQRSPEHLHEAHRQYSLALRSLAESWEQQAQVERDAMFTAILFLSFFEILASYDSSSRGSWRTHLGGLGALFNKCSLQYLHTDTGARIFRQTRSQVLVYALQSLTPVPEVFAKLRPAREFEHFDSCDLLLIRLANLQARCRILESDDSLVTDLIALDNDLDQWTRALPSLWSFSAQPNKHQSGFWWDVRCDVYSSGFIAHTWNKVRAARIMTLDLLEDALLHLSPLPARDLGITWNLTSRQMVVDICATIPTYFRPSSAAARPREQGDPPLIGTVFWHLWVLEVVGAMKHAPPELTTWIVRCFERMYQATGVLKMKLAAGRLRVGHKGPVLP